MKYILIAVATAVAAAIAIHIGASSSAPVVDKAQQVQVRMASYGL